MTLNPWSVLISWKKPESPNMAVVKQYYLTGDIQATIISVNKYVFYFVFKGINPGDRLTISIKVGYDNKVNSTYLKKITPIPKLGESTSTSGRCYFNSYFRIY